MSNDIDNWQKSGQAIYLMAGRYLWVSQLLNITKYIYTKRRDKRRSKGEEKGSKRTATQLSATNNFTPHATCHTRRLSGQSDQIPRSNININSIALPPVSALSSTPLLLPIPIPGSLLDCNGQRFVAVAGPMAIHNNWRS